MLRKSTITIFDEVYEGLHPEIVHGRIRKFLDSLGRPHVVEGELKEAYKAMGADLDREAEALEWSDNLASDIAEAR